MLGTAWPFDNLEEQDVRRYLVAGKVNDGGAGVVFDELAKLAQEDLKVISFLGWSRDEAIRPRADLQGAITEARLLLKTGPEVENTTPDYVWFGLWKSNLRNRFGDDLRGHYDERVWPLMRQSNTSAEG